ncbi:cortactin-binding protein 2 isoform X2 [Amia ocellicauda]|uniref:cortactin-binding protein 2 isoform X2 n=1 Tax=Amia ocellicauda TaxID=2972642 RepID=UPI00346447F3
MLFCGQCSQQPLQKCEFNMDNLSKPELLTLLSIMEGELEARDLVIEALRARRKDVFIQERYGRFSLTDPFLALQRDYESGGGEKEKRAMCTSPLSILEAVMAHCRKMQEKMSAQLAAAESRQKKLELEKSQLQSLEQEHKKLSAQLKDEREKNKHIVMMLVKECKQLAARVVEESQKFDELSAKLEEEAKATGRLEEELTVEKQKGQQMEAKMEKQLSDFDTEREQLRAKLSREEARATDLKLESSDLRKQVEQLRTAKEAQQTAPSSTAVKTRASVSIGVGTDVVNLRMASCQTDALPTAEHGVDGVKKSPLTIPVKPPAANYSSFGLPKAGVVVNARPVADRGMSHSCSALLPGSSQTENGPSGGDSLHPSGVAAASFVSTPMGHSLHSPGSAATLPTGVSPRVQAARNKFQASPTEHDQNGTTTQSPPSRDVSPTNRDNFAAKQQARHTVTQVLSRFTSPQTVNTLRPGLPHSASEGGPFPGRIGHPQIGLKSPTVSRIDRGNPPPIPPKKPGLSQTPSPPHPSIKVLGDGSRSPSTGLGLPSKALPPPSSSPPGIRLINEEVLSKPTTPQLPPKPTLDIAGAGTGCPIPALAASQVGACPPVSRGLHQSACTECPHVIPTSTTAIAYSSSINPVSASSCRPCDTDSPLATASGWCPSLVPSLTCGGPVPLAGRPTLLLEAATQGNVTLLSMLLNQDPMDISHLDEDGYSALYSAAKNGHTDCVKLLLTTGMPADVPDKNGFTPVHNAAANGHFRCIELLTSFGADVNRATVRGQTPLYLASGSGSPECVRLLLAKGADRAVVTRDGWTALHAAVDSGHASCLVLLMYYDASEDGVSASELERTFDPSDFSYMEIIRTWGKRPTLPGNLINHANTDGWTAAHIAASKGFKNCLEVLCSHSNQDIEKRDKCNRTVHDVATDDCKDLLENLYSYKLLVKIHKSSDEEMCTVDIVEDGLTVGLTTVRKHTSWDDLYKSLSQVLVNHCHLLSSGWEERNSGFNVSAGAPIGLSVNSIFSIQIDEATWYPGQTLAQTPWEVIRKSQCQHLTLRLKGLLESSLDELTYASLIPLQFLQNYIRLVEQYRTVIFHGPEGSCQEYLANQISHCIKHKQEAMGIGCDIVKLEVEAELSKEQLVESFINCGFLVPLKEQAGCRCVVVVLEYLERAGSLSELLEDFCEGLENRGSGSTLLLNHAQNSSGLYYFQESSFLIGTLSKSCLHGPELLMQQHFRWVQLRWDSEPLHGLLHRYLKRKLIHKMKGQMPPVSDLLCKTVVWICSVWQQLNSCLSRLGTPEALIGPQMFFSCPVVPAQPHAVVKWLLRLWNAVVVPRVEEAIVSRVTVKRSPVPRQAPGNKSLSPGQQAVVKAALSILVNKAVVQSCPLPRADIDGHLSEFQGGSFPLSVLGTYKGSGKKSRECGSWRKVNTSPRKKGPLTQAWSGASTLREGSQSKTDLDIHFGRKKSNLQQSDHEQSRSLGLDQRFSLCSDDENDLMQELQNMCSSKSEPDISKIAHTKEDFIVFPGSPSGQTPLKSDNEKTTQPLSQTVGSCPSNSNAPGTGSSDKRISVSGQARLKSHLPVPMNKNAPRPHGTPHISSSSSSRSTRQVPLNNNSPEEIWILHRDLHENNNK